MIGYTTNFDRRYNSYKSYLYATNKHHTSARTVTYRNRVQDSFRAWKSRIVLDIPQTTPAGRPVPNIFLQNFESLINLSVGATYSKSRP